MPGSPPSSRCYKSRGSGSPAPSRGQRTRGFTRGPHTDCTPALRTFPAALRPRSPVPSRVRWTCRLLVPVVALAAALWRRPLDTWATPCFSTSGDPLQSERASLFRWPRSPSPRSPLTTSITSHCNSAKPRRAARACASAHPVGGSFPRCVSRAGCSGSSGDPGVVTVWKYLIRQSVREAFSGYSSIRSGTGCLEEA